MIAELEALIIQAYGALEDGSTEELRRILERMEEALDQAMWEEEE